MSPWHGLKLHHGIGKAAQTSQVGAAGEAQEARGQESCPQRQPLG
jgi:hypothetical protein